MPGRDATPDLAVLRGQITGLIAKNAIAMVQNTIDAVNDGQYQALKYLFEMMGLYPAADDETAPEENSLAEILLRHLGIEQDANGEKRE